MTFIFQNKTILSILLLAFILRVYGINFGLPDIQSHPDESLTVSKIFGTAAKEHNLKFLGPFHDFLKIGLFGLNSAREIFGYPPFTTDVDTDLTQFYLLGRFFSVLISTLSILLLFLIVQQLFNKQIALLSSLILSLTFIDAQIAHYLKQCVYVQFLGLLVFWLCLKFIEKQNYWLLYLAVAILGMAAAIKSNVLIMGIVFIFVFVEQIRQKLKRGQNDVIKVILSVILKFSPCLVFLFLGFVLGFWRITFTPDPWHSWQEFLKANRQTAFPSAFKETEASTADAIPSFLWWVYYLFFTGLGPFLFISVAAGLVIVSKNLLSLIKLLVLPQLAILVLTFTYLAILFIKEVHFDRHVTLITPFLAIFGAIFWDSLLLKLQGASSLKSWRQKASLFAISTFFIITFGFSFFKIAAFDYLISLKDTRVLAAEKIRSKIPIRDYIFFEPFSNNVFGVLDRAERPRMRLLTVETTSFTLSDSGDNYVIVSSMAEATAQNYQSFISYKNWHNFFVRLHKNQELVVKISYFLFDKQFFSPHFLEQGATVNNYHNPTIKIYRIQ